MGLLMLAMIARSSYVLSKVSMSGHQVRATLKGGGGSSGSHRSPIEGRGLSEASGNTKLYSCFCVIEKQIDYLLGRHGEFNRKWHR